MTYDLAVLEQTIKRERRKLARICCAGVEPDAFLRQQNLLDGLYRQRENYVIKDYFDKEKTV